MSTDPRGPASDAPAPPRESQQFRKKPVVISAVQWFPGEEVEGVRWSEERDCYVIGTLESEMVPSPGDWIITGVTGEKYACKPDIFALTYEPAPPLPRCNVCEKPELEHPVRLGPGMVCIWLEPAASPAQEATPPRELAGPWAMFFLGTDREPDTPFFVGREPVYLRHAGDVLWGHGVTYTGLWETASDQEHTLREVRRLRAEVIAKLEAIHVR